MVSLISILSNPSKNTGNKTVGQIMDELDVTRETAETIKNDQY